MLHRRVLACLALTMVFSGCAAVQPDVTTTGATGDDDAAPAPNGRLV